MRIQELALKKEERKIQQKHDFFFFYLEDESLREN